MPASQKACQRTKPRPGFSLLEAMIMMVIMSIMAVAAGVALQSLTRVPEKNDAQLVRSNQLVDRMEQLRGTSFASLASGSSGGISWTVVTVDPTGGGSPQADFKQVTVTAGNRTMSSFVTQP